MADATPATTPAPSAPSAQKDWLAFATYFFPLVLIYTMIKHGKEGNYLYHSKNAAGAIVIDIILQIITRVLWSVLAMPILSLVLNLAFLALFILMVYGGWQAANGKTPKLPVITQIGQKIPLEKWFNKDAAPASASPAPAEPPAAPAQPVAEASAPAPAPEPTPAPAAPAAPATPATPTQNPPSQPQA